MTNAFYNRVFEVTPGTRIASQALEDEFARVAAGFDLVAPINNPTLTGTVTVPTPLNPTAAATKAYVDAITVAVGNVPTGGTTGQALVKTGNGDYAMAWGSAGFGLGGTTLTGNVTLTASSAGSTTVTPTAPGLYATLPDATTCSEANNLFLITNAGDFDYGVKDSTGTQLGWIRARTGAMIGLSDNSTAAGVWSYQGLEKTGITASYVNSTLANTAETIRRVALDADRTCFLFGGVDCYAIVYDASTQTWGTATLVRATIGAGRFIGVLSATNQVLVVTCDSTTGMQTVTLTIAGTGVTVNTPVSTTLAGNYSSFDNLLAVPAQSAFALCYGRTSTVGAIRAIVVAGTVPTLSAEATLATASLGTYLAFVSGSIVRTVCSDATTLYVRPFTFSGGATPVAGTSASAVMTSSTFRAFLNGNGRIVAHYLNTNHTASIFSLSGTTETASTVTVGTVATNVTSQSDYVQVTASKTAFMYHPSGTPTWYANILTDTSGTASVGTEISRAVNGNMSALAGLTSSGNTARFSTATSGSNGAIQHVSLDCSGTSPTVSNVQQISYFTAGGGGVNTSLPVASDAYGVRQPKTLIAGNRVHLLGNAVSWDLSFTSAGIQYNRPVPIWGQTSSVLGIVGAAGNESFVTRSFNNLSTGFVINRVEAAA